MKNPSGNNLDRNKSAIGNSIDFVLHNKLSMVLLTLLNIIFLLVLLYCMSGYYGKVNPRLDAFQEILDQAGVRDEAALVKLSGRSAEIQDINREIQKSAAFYFVIMAISFCIIQSLAAAVILKMIKVSYILKAILISLAAITLVVLVSGSASSVKAGIASSMFAPQKPQPIAVAAAIGSWILFLLAIIAQVHVAEVKSLGQFLPELRQKILNSWLKIFISYLCASLAVAASAIIVGILLVMTEGVITFFLSLLGFFIVIPMIFAFCNIYMFEAIQNK